MFVKNVFKSIQDIQIVYVFEQQLLNFSIFDITSAIKKDSVFILFIS